MFELFIAIVIVFGAGFAAGHDKAKNDTDLQPGKETLNKPLRSHSH